MENKKSNNQRNGMEERDWKWVVGILLGIIIFILSYKFWGRSGELTDIISIGSGLVSIALAIVAIIMAVAEGIKSSNKEEKVQVGLDKIISNTDTMSQLIQKLEKDIFNTHKAISSFEDRFAEKYIREMKAYFPLNEDVQINKIDEVLDIEIHKTKPEKEIKKEEEITGQSENVDFALTTLVKQEGVKRRGDVYLADLSPSSNTEKPDLQPVVILSNDISNRFSDLITVSLINVKFKEAKLPTQVKIKANDWNTDTDAVITTEQCKSFYKSHLKKRIAHLPSEKMEEVNDALLIQFALIDF
ncbi:Endoribonuclease EndoA [Bacillus velezensis]|uniref:type II toxin-antitoxin system PemK/MazF family toxin n=1 Tax=Bacillus velezensis TaxID=492670 RepID=UPI00136331D1|nr:type II toxin-antitoxin system PemK/MazF family toxin [Bacillus velezensis]QHM88920.1 Endoribonuclease EndoA [Bacillus velezensis]WES02188.1 type II toxin-antitoxin system PemK/MazF family toxin [Bacillus velezensis]